MTHLPSVDSRRVIVIMWAQAHGAGGAPAAEPSGGGWGAAFLASNKAANDSAAAAVQAEISKVACVLAKHALHAA